MSGEKKEKGLLDEFAEWWGVEDDAPAVPKVETPKVETPAANEPKALKRGKRVQTFFVEEEDPEPEPKPKKEPKPKEGE